VRNRGLRERSVRRAAPGCRAASRTGTCPGSSASAYRSAAGSPPRDKRARAERASGRRRSSTAGLADDVARKRQQPFGSRRAVREREHRTVLEVEVGPLTVRGLSTDERGAREHATDNPQEYGDATTHRVSSSEPV